MAYTPSRVAQVNAAGANDALFLKLYAGEVLSTFARTNIMLGLTMVRTIEHGKSASFPCTGQNTATYHTPGTDIDGNVIKSNERVINIDSLLISPVFIPMIDEAMNHYDYRSIYSSECGRALAFEADKRLLQVTIVGARQVTPVITGGFAGKRIINVNMKTDATVLTNSIISAAQNFDEKNVPSDDRHCALLPAQYYLLCQNTNLQNSTLRGPVNIQDASILPIAGIQIHKTNNVPQTLINAAITGENNTYYDATTFANSAGVCFQRSATGTVKLLDLSIETEYTVQKQATLVVAKFAMGHNWLRPEAAAELATA